MSTVRPPNLRAADLSTNGAVQIRDYAQNGLQGSLCTLSPLCVSRVSDTTASAGLEIQEATETMRRIVEHAGDGWLEGTKLHCKQQLMFLAMRTRCTPKGLQ